MGRLRGLAYSSPSTSVSTDRSTVKLTYPGPLESVTLYDLGITAKRGEAVEIPDVIAADLIDQGWKAPKGPQGRNVPGGLNKWHSRPASQGRSVSKAESTYGTPVTVDRFFPLVSESLAGEVERIESAAIIAGNTMLTSEQWTPVL